MQNTGGCKVEVSGCMHLILDEDRNVSFTAGRVWKESEKIRILLKITGQTITSLIAAR